MSSSLIAITQHYVICPHCQQNSGHTIDHLIADRVQRSWGPWYCNECGFGYSGTVSNTGEVEVHKVAGENSFTPHLNLLVIPPQTKPIYLVVEGRHPTGRDWDGTRFYYEEHSCPTNWLENIKLVCFDGDEDPHGLIQYVASIKYDKSVVDIHHHEFEWTKTFPQIAHHENRLEHEPSDTFAFLPLKEPPSGD